jgi:hypothetical protein
MATVSGTHRSEIPFSLSPYDAARASWETDALYYDACTIVGEEAVYLLKMSHDLAEPLSHEYTKVCFMSTLLPR